MTLVLRIPKGDKLTKAEMDNNLTYLEGLSQSKLGTGSFNTFSGSVVTDIIALEGASGSFSTRVTSLENFSSSLNATYATDVAFHAFTSSYATGSFTGSFKGDGSGLTGVPSSLGTGSFATTGSNAFVGAQVITGSLTISGSTTQSGSIDISGSINADGFELDITSTTNIPSLNSQFNLDLSGSATPFIYKTLVLNDGKVLVAGRFESIGGHTTNDIARLNSNGSVDTSFTATNIGGGFSATSQYINTFVTQSDGKIVIAGSFSSVQGSSRTGVAILNTNGTLDSGFSNPGFTTFSEVRDVVIQSDDKIVVVGRFDGGIKRLNTDGTIDASLSVPDSTGFTDNAFYSVALQTVSSTDYILVGGDFNQWNTSASYKRIARIGISGSLDTSFGGTNLDISSASGDVIRKIKVGAVDNNVYVAGKFLDTTGLNRHAGFARILTSDDYGDGIGAFDRFFRTYIGVGATVYDFDFYSTDRILLGGDFSQIGFQSVQSANKFAIVNESNGGTVSNWFADLLSGVYNVGNNNVRSVLQIPSTSNVLIGGTFTTVNSTTRENLASLKLAGFGEVTTTSDYSITANSNQLLISSSNTYFSGDVNISASVTASIFTGSFVGDGSGLTGIPSGPSINTGSFATTGSNTFVGTEVVNGAIIVTGSLNLRSASYPTSGSLVRIDDTRTHIFVRPSGSSTSGNIQLYDSGDSRSILIINASQTSIGSEATSNAYGNNNAQNFIRGNTQFFQNITSSANIQAVSFIGDGSGLTGIPVIGTGSFATTGSNTFVGNQTISGSLLVTHRIESTGSLILQPNANDYINRFLEIYNTSPTDTHITASGGQIFIGDDTTYVKVDNYSNFNRIDIVANSGVYVSGLTEITGSLLVTGSANVNGFVVLPQVSASFNFADDTAAAGGGVPLGGLYHTSGSIKIRLA